MDASVRWARQDEWDEAMEMVWNTFLRFNSQDCTPEGIQGFRDFITSEKLKEAFVEGSYQLMVALQGGRIIGVGSLRGINHLSLLFVDGDHHLQGVGRMLLERLCDYLKNEVGEYRISLTASPVAVGFYKKLGFMQVRPKVNPTGIPVVYMEKVFM